MIPKQIHYCWFGGKELPKQAKRCIASWEKHCPDWKIIRWDEHNFDFDRYPFAAWCLKNQKWAFLSDIARLAVVLEHGGVYLDTDVELVRSPDPLCETEAFFGFQMKELVATGLGFGAEPGQTTVKAMLDAYLELRPDEAGDYPLIPCPQLNTEALERLGLIRENRHQRIAGAEVYPMEYFCPYDYTTGKTVKTENTYSIHWYNQSWISPMGKLRCTLTRPFHRIFGVDCFRWLKKKQPEN